TPLPPNTQLSHIPTRGDKPARGFRLSCARLTAPVVNAVVSAAKVPPADVPKRSSAPSRLPSAWLTGNPATAGNGTARCPPSALALGTVKVSFAACAVIPG